MKDLKDGRKTTEFWLTVFAQIIGGVVLFGVVTADEASTLTEALDAAIKAVTALVIALAPLIQYIKGRTEIKKLKG